MSTYIEHSVNEYFSYIFHTRSRSVQVSKKGYGCNWTRETFQHYT